MEGSFYDKKWMVSRKVVVPKTPSQALKMEFQNFDDEDFLNLFTYIS
jgi:hypothetical protein